MMGGFRDLIVWQKSIDLVAEVYHNTSKFPRDEIFALTSQIRRCAVSIPSNIAEGEGRKGASEFAHFLRIAQGSLAELQTQLIISERLGFLPQAEFGALSRKTDEVGKLLHGLIRSTSKGTTQG